MNRVLHMVAACAALAVLHVAHAGSSLVTPEKRAALCNTCGIVTSVKTEQRKGEASGLGLVGGAVVGGVLGHQVGGGTGKTLATIGGAAAGGYAGNEIEKNAKKHTVWVTQVTLKNGSTRRFEQGANSGFKAGDVVTIDGHQIRRR